MQLYISRCRQCLSFLLTLPQALATSAIFARDIVTYSDLGARQAPAVVPTSSFMRRAFQASTVAGHWLYIDGGSFSFKADRTLQVDNFGNNGTVQTDYATTLLSIDLSKDWTNDTVAIQSTPKPAGAPSLNSPSLWYHAKENALYSGFTGWQTWWLSGLPPFPQLSLWKITPDGAGGGSYTQVIPPGKTPWSTLIRPSQASQAFGPDEAYILGGNDQNQGAVLPGVIRLDMNTLQFTNISAPWDKSPWDSSSGVQKGNMIYIPSFGPDGMYIAMGGYTSSNTSGLISFESVYVFDPSNQIWYNQTTTGSWPSARIEYCIAGIESSNQSYEIFVYGGWGTVLGSASVSFDTVHILTIPAFHWTSCNYPPQNPRFGHSCNAVGGSQVISIGGLDANPMPSEGNSFTSVETTFNTTADPFTQGLAIFDMTNLAWSDHFTANQPPYQQSDQIQQFYSQNNNSYRQNLNTNVAALMSHTNFSTPSPAGSSKTSATSSPPVSSKVPVIAGSTVAGILALALVASIAFFILRRRRNRRNQYPDAPSDSPEDTKWQQVRILHEAEMNEPVFEMGARNDKVHEMPKNEVMEIG